MAGFDEHDGELAPVGQVSQPVASPPVTKPKPRPKRAPRSQAFPDSPFTALGYNHGTYYYLSHGSSQVVALPTAGHTPGNLLGIAPLEYWEANFSDDSSASTKKIQAEFIANCLIKANHKVGVYDPSRIRGRGAWWDEGRSVMHAGDRLIVNGVWTNIPEFETKYIYEAGIPIEIAVGSPLSAAEASKFGALLSKLTWEEPISARLVAGWCVCALIAGALQWHPHLWIVGAAGQGKSFAMEKIISEILLGFALEFKSSVTTEPGIRRSLSGASLPVMLDDPDGNEAIDKIVQLMRACSQSGRAKAAQGGGVNGSAVQFELLSSFICSSINLPITEEADIGRISIVTLDNSHMTQKESEDHFFALKQERATLLTETYCNRFQARAVAMIPVIRATIEPMSLAASRVLGSRRGGDQIGSLLAGAWSLLSDKPPTLDEAIEWIAQKDLSREVAIRRESDELVCMRTIAQSVLQMDHGIHRRVDELVRAAAMPYPAPGEPLEDHQIEVNNYRKAANATLRRHGIMAIGEEYDDKQRPLAITHVAISNNDKAIERILRGTPWDKNWGLTLERIKPRKLLTPRYFTRGENVSASRAVAIPLSVFLGESPEAQS